MIEQLANLAELAPEICQVNQFGVYQIGEYRFNYEDNIFHASCEFLPKYNIYHAFGQSALDWLQGALQRAIEASGRYWELRHWKPRGKYEAEVANETEWADTPVQALLGALIKALKVKR